MAVFSLLCVSFLFVCTVTDFSAAEKVGGVKFFACVFDYYPDGSSSILVNVGHGVP